MLGLPLLLNNVSVFISQILKQRKIVVGLLVILILICSHPINPHGYLKVQLMEQVFCDASKENYRIAESRCIVVENTFLCRKAVKSVE